MVLYHNVQPTIGELTVFFSAYAPMLAINARATAKHFSSFPIAYSLVMIIFRSCKGNQKD